MKTKFMVVTALLLVLGSCAHHRDVRPGPEGVHRVVIRTEDDSNQRDAISQANHYCKQQEKSAVILEEKTSYTGKVDEETYNNTKTVSKILKTTGSMATVFGGRNEKNIGGVGILAGVGADAAMGQGYTVEMKFKCQ